MPLIDYETSRHWLIKKILVAVVDGKVVQTVTVEDKVISKQSDSEY